MDSYGTSVWLKSQPWRQATTGQDGSASRTPCRTSSVKLTSYCMQRAYPDSADLGTPRASLEAAKQCSGCRAPNPMPRPSDVRFVTKIYVKKKSQLKYDLVKNGKIMVRLAGHLFFPFSFPFSRNGNAEQDRQRSHNCCVHGREIMQVVCILRLAFIVLEPLEYIVQSAWRRGRGRDTRARMAWN